MAVRPKLSELKEALQTFITDHEAEIVSAVVVQGLPVTVDRVARTPFTFPISYPFWRVSVLGWQYTPGSGNQEGHCAYNVLVEVGAEAKVVMGELPYEGHTTAFDIMEANFAELLLDQQRFGDCPDCFEIDRQEPVTGQEMSGVVETEGQEYPRAFLHRGISFRMKDCR